MPTLTRPAPTVQGVALDMGPEGHGRLRVSGREDAPTDLADRLGSDGYLFIPGFFHADRVREARGPMAQRIGAAGRLHPEHPASELIARPGVDSAWLDGLTDDNAALTELLYGRATMGFFDSLFGGAARHYDFTWSRAVSHGAGTAPHCDVVFMGRGTPRVVTMWTAMCDIPEDVGGLCILEGSHLGHNALRAYRAFDVDTYCENLGATPVASMGTGGSFPCEDANQLRRMLGGRWLWSEYRAGDVIVFGLGTVHASLDNRSNRMRVSTDTRYQLESEPVDERWVGAAPIGHSLASQQPRIC